MSDPGAADAQAAANQPSDVVARQAINVEVDREASELRVWFEDGEPAKFDLLDLRLGCPCAGCRGRREQGQAAFVGEQISVRDAELHGNWGIAMRWSDGHDTGIYAWSYLRRWWDAGTVSLP